MNAREPSGQALVARSPSDLAPAPPPGALVPGDAIVARGSSLPRSTAFALVGCSAVNVAVYSLMLSNTVPQPTLIGAVFTLAGGLGLFGLQNLWKRWRADRRMDAAAPLYEAEGTRGQTVRLVGVVQRPPALLATPKGHAGVLVRYQGCRGTSRGPGWAQPWRWELHAVDFCIRADDGRELWVDTRSLVLLPHPPVTGRYAVGQRRHLYLQATGERRGPLSWIYDEELIAPGDRIEVSGTLDMVPHPSASAGSDRGPRLRPVLRGTAASPVQVRRFFV
jgi:hypothetical protein